MEERKIFLCSCVYMPKPTFCLQPTAIFMEKLKLCRSAGVTFQMFSSSGGESCIAASPPEQELITVLSTSVMFSLFLKIKDFIKYFLTCSGVMLAAHSNVILHIHICIAV